MMKRIMVLGLVLVLCSMLFASPAMAVSAKYSTTQAFLDALDDADIIYTLYGVSESSQDEIVRVNNKNGDFSYTINYYFSDDLEDTAIRVWNFITYADADLAKVLRSCNTLNADYRFTKFYCDESDNTVSVDMDVIYRPGDSIGDIMLEATLHVVNILDEAHEVLAVYDR